MTEATVVTDRDAFLSTAADAPTGTRVPVEVSLPVDDPFDAYRRARGGDGDGGAFLETTGGQSGWGYFGVDPIERLTVGPQARSRNAPVDGEGSSGRAPTGDDSPTLAALQALLQAEALRRGDCEIPCPCGAIGWLSYDVVRELEDLPGEAVDDRDLPRFQAAFFDRLAAWECPTTEGETTLRITACPAIGGEGDRTDADAAFDRGQERALDLVDRIEKGDPDVPTVGDAAGDATFESDCTPETYADRVRAVKEYVRAGDTFQANVSQRLSAPAAVHPVAAYDALRSVNPAPYSALLELPAADLVSASPELLLERDGDRIRTEPIAGTRPRSDDPEADAALETELTSDEKERAEHAMLVDLERNDLGKVAAYGTVEVTEYRRVDRYSEVMHLVSLVEGKLREGATLADAIAAVFPGGTITGAPKPRTMEIIDELEGTRRGPYTGSIGIFGFDGRATLNIVIRTLVRHEDRYDLRVGAGIVHDSVPQREYRETLDKGRALVNAVDRALGERASLAVNGEAIDVDALDEGGEQP
ncbi:para-aminobenzoate synthase component I [Salinarchaeum sp. Harcht-Bsk1]|uniref:anthranilate synthase component I family protein n=1 Tax=Salinarchaeum sp. Harcht-Bsk1 TaxID=1333523 RepID=UPI0003423F61|nr:anthranilate synthase component I family protein [Salinarchaeum sp. Harcht-Bsk1]AGN02559.1 para-aminobenzoate synthase component I [Salinarchaeum sp. Harcht-Bsk1]